jgi:hypothetical protein
MAVYYCHQCGNYKDGDYFPMEEDELCPDCHNDNEFNEQEEASEGCGVDNE